MANVTSWPAEQTLHGYSNLAAVTGAMIVRDTAGRPRAGVIAARPDLIAKRADWALDVQPVMIVRVDGVRASIGGTDALEQVTIAPSPAANSRIDVIYGRPQRPDLGDPASCLGVSTGTPGAVPTKPSIPAGAVELATLTVPASATSTSGCTLTITAKHTCMTGGVIRFTNAADRDGFAAVDGQLGLVDGKLYRRAGTSWVPLASSRAGMVTRATGTLSAISGVTGWYGVAFTVPVPAQPAAGEELTLIAIRIGTGWGSVWEVGQAANGANTDVSMRYMQAGSNASQNVTFIWEIRQLTN